MLGSPCTSDIFASRPVWRDRLYVARLSPCKIVQLYSSRPLQQKTHRLAQLLSNPMKHSLPCCRGLAIELCATRLGWANCGI